MSPNRITRALHRRWIRDPDYRFLFDAPPADEWVAIDCETTGLDRRKDDIITVAAVIVRSNRILTSRRFEAMVKPVVKIDPNAIKVHRLRERDVATGRAMAEVLPNLLRFIGSRPLVGYYLEFDCALIDRYVKRWLGVTLPNERVEVSSLYFERKYKGAPPGTQVDLKFQAILDDLGLPMLDQHDAYSDALMTAMIFLALKDLKERGVRISRGPHRGADAIGAG